MLVFPCTPSFIIFDIWLCSLYLPLIWKEHIFPIRNRVVTFAFEGWWYFLWQTASLYVSLPGCVPSSPPISSSPFCTALSFSQHGCYRRHWGLQWCPASWKYPLSFLLPAVSWFIFNIPTSSTLTTPTLRSPYLSLAPSHLAVFLFTFLFCACATMVKDNISTANPASFPLYYPADTFLCACTSDVAHTYMYIWPQLNNVNACEQKSFVWLVNSFRRGSFATGLVGLSGLRWCFILKGSFTQNENCHLLTLMLFQTSVTYFLMQNTKIFGWMLVIEHFHSMDQKKKNPQTSLRIFFACKGAPRVHLILRKCLNQ